MSSGHILPSTLVRGIEQLEPMPVTAQRLVALMHGGRRVARRRLPTRRVRSGNRGVGAAHGASWAHAGSRPPETVRDAVVRLGTVPLLNLVLGEYLSRLRTAAPLYDLTKTISGDMPQHRSSPFAR
jgi:hypothetical protein